MIRCRSLGCVVIACTLTTAVHAQSWSGYVAPEVRYFSSAGTSSEQSRTYFSTSGEIEHNRPFADGAGTFDSRIFARWDQRDSERSNGDIRELSWVVARDHWEWRAGIRRVFWGVTESQHLVDIINQTDLVENPDGEDKLGQPMLNAAYIADFGTIDVFYLPIFRERTAAGLEGRLRGPYVVDSDQVQYESHRGQYHPDFALRWSGFAGIWDFGLSHFYGTSREPTFSARQGASGQDVVLVPYYDLLHQTGLDLQATVDSWLYKLEYVHRINSIATYNALVTGIEYTFFGVNESASDVGVIAEYLFDDRDEGATTPFANDLMMGIRWVANDVQSTELLVGVIVDLDGAGHALNVEGSRRLGDSWKLTAEVRAYESDSSADLLYGLRNDDYFQVELARYF